MCGICGVVGGAPDRERDRVRRMTRALSHRGPDDEGQYVGRGAVLGHRRLTIIDLSQGRQPLSNEDGTVWVTYNGEIYNYRELRRRLVKAGHRFRTDTDTEVLVHLYEEEGPECVRSLRGMFAFGIWDERNRTFFAARDRFGQKPLYYAVRGDRLLFASEAKSLLAHPAVDVEPEPAAIDYYLSLRFVPAPLTIFRDVRKLPAGHTLRYEDGELSVDPYWRWEFDPDHGRSERAWVDELSGRLEETVRSHMVSDVPVGGYLSGGMDSSIIVALMSKFQEESVPTFAIGSGQESFDETPFARLVAGHCGTRHRERYVDVEKLGDIPRLVRCLDEPSDPIAACMYEAARLASGSVKVVLGGDGGDEVFAGFDRYAAFQWVNLYSALPRWMREDVLRPLVGRLPESFSYKSWSQRLRWLVEVGAASGGERYGLMTSFFRFGPEDREQTYGGRMRELLAGPAAERAMVEPFEGAPASSPLGRMLYADSVTRLPEHTLMLTDRLSMAHGLEVRAPFLDHELAEFTARMPDRMKVRRGTTKYALRKAARQWLPDAIVDRPKQGFMFPVAYWLDEPTLVSVRDHLRSGPLVRDDWIEPAAVDRLAREHARHAVDNHVRLWMLLNLDAWFRLYVDGDETGEIQHQIGAEPGRSSSGRKGGAVVGL